MKSSRLFTIIAFLLSAPLSVYAACTGSSPTWTATPDDASVASCISQASPEDTINVSAGNWTLSTAITLNKGLKIIGAGQGVTNVSVATSGVTAISYTPASGNLTANYAFRLSGFSWNLNGNKRVLGLYAQAGNTAAKRQTNIRVDHNTVTNSTTAASFVYNYNCYGVVDQNIIDVAYPFRNYGTNDGHELWADVPTWGVHPGTADAMYYEDNNITLEPAINAAVSNCDQGGKYVFRYNNITINAAGVAGPLFDMHNGRGTMWGCFGGEVYGNSISSSSYGNILIKGWGGKEYVHHNNITSSASWYMSVYEDTVAGQCPPAPIDDQIVHDSYFFEVRKNQTGTPINVDLTYNTACVGHEIYEGTNFWDDTTSSGVRYGNQAAREAASCTVGQGWWQTNQSTSDLTGMTGMSPATPISGTLYTCTTPNTWTSHHTLYTYPHPFRGPATVISEVTPVPTPSSDITPTYTFTTDQNGSVSYGGSCGNGNLATATVGENSTTYSLSSAPATYADCTITVGASNVLTLTSFTITGPTVNMTAPASGTISGTTTVTATASHADGIAGITFMFGGVAIAAEDTSSPYTINWDTTTIANGPGNITAVARATGGSTNESSAVAVTILNNPVRKLLMGKKILGSLITAGSP